MKEKIHAVSNNHISEILDKLGLTEHLENGLLYCCCCEKKLSLDNIGCLFPFETEVRLCCNSLECIERTVETISPVRNIQTEEEANSDES